MPARGPILTATDITAAGFMPMGQADAAEVGAWQYPGMYAFYDFAADADDLAELLDPEPRYGRYFVARVTGVLFGFVEVKPAPSGVELGLGLRPDCTGQNLGLTFVRRACNWVTERWEAEKLVLLVAVFNRRAITVYERAGFIAVGRELIATNGATVEFLRMETRDFALGRPDRL